MTNHYFGWHYWYKEHNSTLHQKQLNQRSAKQSYIIACLLTFLWQYFLSCCCDMLKAEGTETDENSSVVSLIHQQGHAGSKTLHQQSPPVLNWRCGLMQVDLYIGRKMVVVVADIISLHVERQVPLGWWMLTILNDHTLLQTLQIWPLRKPCILLPTVSKTTANDVSPSLQAIMTADLKENPANTSPVRCCRGQSDNWSAAVATGQCKVTASVSFNTA